MSFYLQFPSFLDPPTTKKWKRKEEDANNFRPHKFHANAARQPRNRPWQKPRFPQCFGDKSPRGGNQQCDVKRIFFYLKVVYRYIIEIRWEWLCFQENVGADSPRNEVQSWFLVISKSWQTEAAGLLLELWMQMSRGCCDFLKLHPVDGNYPSGNQHSPVWEKQRSSSSTLWLGICSFPGGYM